MNIDEMQAGREKGKPVSIKKCDKCSGMGFIKITKQKPKPDYLKEISEALELEKNAINSDKIIEYLDELQLLTNGIPKGWTLTNSIIGKTYTVSELINLVNASPPQRREAALKALGVNA